MPLCPLCLYFFAALQTRRLLRTLEPDLSARSPLHFLIHPPTTDHESRLLQDKAWYRKPDAPGWHRRRKRLGAARRLLDGSKGAIVRRSDSLAATSMTSTLQ